MLSKKSSSNAPLFSKTLFKKNLSRFWPLWGGVSLLGSIAPLFLLLMLMTTDPRYFSVPEFTEIFYSVLCYVVPALTLCYAVLCAMVVWSYLFSARSVGLMHTLPVDRRCLYITGVLSGLAMLLLPYAIVGGLIILELLAFGVLPGLAVLQTIAGVLAMSVFFFSTATVCAMVTGHVFALPVFYFIAHFFAIGLYYLLSQFSSNFLFGYVGGNAPPDYISFLSPTVFIYQNFNYTTSSYLEESTASRIWTCHLNGMWVIGVYALIGLVLLAAGYFLYGLRHSESAGDVVAFRWLKPFFRYGVAVCSALTAGQLLYEIVWHIPFQQGDYYQILPMALCMLATGAVGFYIASMLLAKSLRVFRRSWTGLVTVAAMVTIICTCVGLDLFGVASYVPPAEDIRHLYFYGNLGDGLHLEEGDPLLADVLALHEEIIASEDAIRRADDAFRWEDGTTHVRLRFTYTRQDGSEVQRRYPLVFTEAEWNDPASCAGQLNRLLNSPAALEDRYTLEAGYTLTYGYFSSHYDSYGTQLTTEQGALLLAALQADMAAGNLLNADPFGTSLKLSLGDLQLEGQQPRRNEQNNGLDYWYDSVYTVVRPEMTCTIATLRQLGLLTDEALEAFRKDCESSYAAPDIYLNPNSAAFSSFPTVSIGVIGGADAPTEITVSR